MSGETVVRAANVVLPGAGAVVTVLSAAPLATALDLSAYEGQCLWLKADVKTHIHAGSTDAVSATAGNIYLTPDVDYRFAVPRDGSRSFVQLRGAAGGLFYYRESSEPL